MIIEKLAPYNAYFNKNENSARKSVTCSKGGRINLLDVKVRIEPFRFVGAKSIPVNNQALRDKMNFIPSEPDERTAMRKNDRPTRKNI